MRRIVLLLSAVAVSALAGCADTGQAPTATDPVGGGPQFGPPQVANPYCSPTSSDAIEAQLHDLFVKNAWPDENSTKGKFQNVQNLLAAGDVVGAQQATKLLVDFITNKFEHLTPAEQAASQAQYDQLLIDLWCYVGISGKVFDLNPGDPEKAFDIPGVGGVNFPADVVPVGTLVSLTDLSGQPCPLLTVLDCFPGFISISLHPATTLPQPAVVVLCPSIAVPASALVGHQDPTVGFEVLTPAAVPPLLAGTCPTSSGQRSQPSGWMTRLVDAAANVLLPTPLQAAPMMFLGGIGGLTTKFSPFGVVSSTLTGTGGLGGRTTSFTPPPASAPSATPSNPPLPPTFVQGGVGTTATTNLPFVTIMTQGGDPDGSNPVPGVTVTFSTGASQSYDPDSQAKVCDAAGVVPGSGQIQVVTDALGVATLPCLAFGNTAGFANLSASFDPTTLNFPNSDLITVVADDGTALGSTINWLVKSNPGQPAALSLVTAPSSSAQAGVPFAQQPVIQVLDGLGNLVPVAGLEVVATVTAGGGTAAYTAPLLTDVDGLATFTDLSIGGPVAGQNQTVSFSFTGIGQPLTATVFLTPGPAAQLGIIGQPSSTAAAGVAFGSQPVVAVQDQFANLVDVSLPVVAAIASGPGTLAGTTTITSVNGVATFTDLRIDGATGARTLSFTSGQLASPASAPIAVGAGPAAQLVWVTQPSSTAQAGVAWPTQPVLALQDQFGNQTNSAATVVASLGSGAGTLAGTLSIAAINGVVTYQDLRIDGVVGPRTVQFTSGTVGSAPSNTIDVTAGAAAAIQTYISGVAAQTYSYGTNLTAFTNASPPPQVIVTDPFGNPVGNQVVYWTAATTNGSVLTVGPTGTPTNAAGTAQVTSWLLGDGLNQATAGLFAAGVTPPSGYLDAQFTATTPTGVSVFACAATVNAKTDLGAMSIKAPNGTIKRITLRMSITGTSNALSNYDATLEARLNGLTGTLLGSTTGKVQLPGDNGNAVPVTFTFPTSIAKQSASSTIWFKLTIATPANRKPQVWYRNATFKSNDPCFNALVYAPGSTTVFKRGLSINVTN
jgi:hypothetical protein